MKKSLIAFALFALAMAATAFPISPHGGGPGGYPVAQAFTSTHDAAPVAAIDVGATQALQAARTSQAPGSDASTLPLIAQTECRGCKVAVHPGCGEREPHPLVARKKGGGGKRCIDIATSPHIHGST